MPLLDATQPPASNRADHAPALYTAAEIAARVGQTRQAIGQALKSIAPNGRRLEGREHVNTWLVTALPEAWQIAFAEISHQSQTHRGLLAPTVSARLWQPKTPWNNQPQPRRERAAHLRSVLLPLLETNAAERLSQAEFETAGRTAYARELGHSISGSGLRAIYQRTIARDGGRKNFARLEIYLDDYLSTPPAKFTTAFDHAPLRDRLLFKDPVKPSLIETQNAFDFAFAHLENLAAQCPARRGQVKRSILRCLIEAAPALAESPAALKRNFNRKHRRWQYGGQLPSAIKDGRATAKTGAHLDQLKPDIDLIVAEAFHHDGKLALAIRKLRRDGALSQAFTDRYTLDLRRNKSYVARSIRNEITARLTGLLEYRQSRWAVERAGPFIARSHDYAPGDYFAADDVSWNIYFWHLDDAGQPVVTRGECLVWIDCRSLYPLGYVLSAGHYNGETIRKGILHLHDRHGLPHRSMVFERGIWESRLITGARPKDFLSWDEYEMNLRDRGLKMELRNVTTPGAKMIEGVFNIIQQGQRNERGFVGFNERSYGQEELQRIIGRVKRGLVHPREYFYSMEEWRDRLDASLEAYAHEPQNGKLLQGKSPAELFADHRPLRKLDANSRFLLSTHRVRTRVRANGLSLTIRGHRRFYYNDSLGHLRGREVLAFYNIEEPDLVTVTDLNMYNPISFTRQELSAFDATKDELAEAHQQRRGFMKDARLEYDRLRHPLRRSIQREDALDADAQNLGRLISDSTRHVAANRKTRQSLEAKAQRAAEKIGLNAPGRMRNPDRFIQGAQLWQETEREIAAEQNNPAEL